MKRVHVEIAPAYDVLIGHDALRELSPAPGRLAVLMDENVERLHGDDIRSVLSPHDCVFGTVRSGEQHKTLREAERLFDWLADHRIERSERLVAIGGGVTGDLVGFVAATWRRGIPFIQVPTTILSQVDASVGGKVAVDHPAGKNLIGAFHQPAQVLADTRFLQTLPRREVWSGLAEVVKTALLAGEPLMTLVEDNLEALARGEAPLEDVVAECVAYKAGVVQRDPREHGERAVLNLGHTVGHALESLGGYTDLLHGEAVAWGMRAALLLSGIGKDSREYRLVERLEAPRPEAVDVERILDAMQSDKKVASGRVRWVLLEKAGKPEWNRELPEAEVRSVLQELADGRL